MNVEDGPLRDLTVQINLFSVAWLPTRDETAINNAEGVHARPDLSLQWIVAYIVT